MAFVFVASGWGKVNDRGEFFSKADVVDLSKNGLLRGVREMTVESAPLNLYLEPVDEKGKKGVFYNLPSGIYIGRVEIVERFSKKEQLFKNICYVHDLKKCSCELDDIYEFFGSFQPLDKSDSKTNGVSSGFQIST